MTRPSTDNKGIKTFLPGLRVPGCFASRQDGFGSTAPTGLWASFAFGRSGACNYHLVVIVSPAEGESLPVGIRLVAAPIPPREAEGGRGADVIAALS